MIFDFFKKTIAILAKATPNSFLPKIGVTLSNGRIPDHDWAELYLFFRFVFSIILATILPKSGYLVFVVAFIQGSSLIYLLKIVFPTSGRNLKDPSRSLFFAFGHYLEIAFSMGYVYWYVDCFGLPNSISRLDGVYFSFVTMTTIGYGDIVAKSDVAKIIVMLHSVVSLFMLATVIGLFLSLASSNEPNEKV